MQTLLTLSIGSSLTLVSVEIGADFFLSGDGDLEVFLAALPGDADLDLDRDFRLLCAK